jgi:hypothetical protein
MKIGRFFLLWIFYLFLMNSSQGMEKDLEKGDGTLSLSPMHSVRATDVETNITSTSPVVASAPKVSKCLSCLPIYETLLGSFLSLAGYGMITAGSIVAVELGSSHVSAPLLGIGGAAKQAGAIFFSSSQQRAALIEQKLDDHVTKAKSENLSTAEIQALSDEFFATSELYQSYLKYGSCLDGFFAKTFNFIGIPLALVGMGFTVSGEHTMGPILVASGTAVHELSGWLQGRAEALTAQKTRIDAINVAKTKAGVR